MILNGEFPPDIRVEKECDVLLKAKLNVFILSCVKGLRSNTKREKKYKNITICYTAFRYPDKVRKNLDNVKNFLGMWTLLQKKILQFIDEYGIDVIHAHDLPVAEATVKAIRKRKIPVVSDFHENYPYLQISGKKKSIIKFRKWFKIERRTVRASNFVITTCDEMKNRIINEHRTHPQKIITLSNVYANEFNNLKLHESILNKYKQRKMFLYTGVINQRKGCKTLIEAVYYLKKHPEILLCLVGFSKNNEKMKKLQDLVSFGKIENQIEFVEWQPIDKIYSYIIASYACIVPFERNVQNDCCSPHKLFQYMACGKPVIVSDCPSIANIVDRNHCGLVFEGGNSKNLAEKMLALYTDNQMCILMGENGRNAVKNKYNFRIEGEKLLNLYREIANSLCYNKKE